MTKLNRLLMLISLALLLQSCSFNLETIDGLPGSTKAKAFSDDIVALIIREDKRKLYELMGSLFKKTYPVETMDDTFSKMSGHFGKLVDTEYKTEELVNWQYPDGTKTLARKYWYKAKTTNAEMGKYFLQVTVFEEDKRLACLAFSLLEFPDGPPEALR